MGIHYLQIGERIRSLRELRGMTVATLAEKTSFTSKSLLLAENGRASLSLEFLLELCDALDVTPNDILRGQFREREMSLTEQEQLLDELIARFSAESEETKSMTKINDTDQTLKKIEAMINNQKRDNRRLTPVEDEKPKKTWHSTFYR